jgi:fatty acid desaturase
MAAAQLDASPGQLSSAGEEFREDLRAPGSLNAQARKTLSAQELAPLTQLSNLRASLSILLTLGMITGAAVVALWAWSLSGWAALWVLPALLVMAITQHGLFILAHESAHYRLFTHRGWNDRVGRLMGMAAGISMCTYRVTHRLHHNHLYGPQDPDTALHGGYPRGVAYLWKKLAVDITGVNAWKTFAYFFGSPAINDETQTASRPLDDTSPQLRADARQDRWGVVAFHVLVPLLLWATLGPWAMLAFMGLWWLPMITFLQPILRVRAICEHGAVSDTSSPLTAARSNRTHGSLGNWVGRFLLFPHHVNYHLEHHLYPAVPHYNLPALHRALAEKGALQGAEVRNISESLKLVFAPKVPRSSRV